MNLDRFKEKGLFYHKPNDLPVVDFQVIGERGSSTNLARKLIERNIVLERSDALGWKHAPPRMVAIPRDLLVIGVIRNAESWALSMHKRPWHLDPRLQVFDFSRFIRSPWVGIVDRPTDFPELDAGLHDRVQGLELQMDRHPITGQPYSNLFEMRRIKLASMLGMLNRGCHMVLAKAEVIQQDPEGYVQFLCDEVGLPMAREKVQRIKRRLGTRFSLSVPEEVRGKTPKKMSPADRAFMIQALDMPLEEMVGYSYEAAESASETLITG